MGNVPISCCRSKSPRNYSASRSGSQRNGSNSQYSSSGYHEQHHSSKFSGKQSARPGEEYEPSYILQHISEREPDDSETDPSSNPYNRPIFATRSSSKNTKATGTGSPNQLDAYNDSSDFIVGKQSTTSPISSSSQDNGYNSNATTSSNLTHHHYQLPPHHHQQQQSDYGDQQNFNDSFERKSISRSSNDKRNKEEQIIGTEKHITCDNHNQIVSSQHDQTSSRNIYTTLQSFPSIHRLPTNREFNSHLQSELTYLPKASSCSTIYIDHSTISQPDLHQTIKCVSLAIYYHIRSRSSDSSAEIFDESIHPLRMPPETVDQSKSEQDNLHKLILRNNEDQEKENDYSNEDKADGEENSLDEPDRKTIYNFVKTLFKSAQLTSEYAITTLVYLERLMTYAEMDLCPRTWRRMFLGAILLSSKVWEDQAVWNVDYAQILEDITVEDINELERQFLELIQFNMNVPSSVYAKYYFHLRTLAFKNGLIRQQRLMTIGKAKTLEAMSRVNRNDWHNSPIHRKPSSSKLNRHVSFERGRLNGLATAVLM